MEARSHLSVMKGYGLDGEEIIECLSNGSWSAETPVCKGDQTSSSDRNRISQYFIGLVIFHYLYCIAVF